MKKHRKQNLHKHRIDMENRFTEGVWMVSGGRQIVSMPSQCKISNNISGWNYEEAEANAKLIAAAPDLLNALDAVMRSYERYCPERYYKDDNVALADDAIKKATE